MRSLFQKTDCRRVRRRRGSRCREDEAEAEECLVEGEDAGEARPGQKQPEQKTARIGDDWHAKALGGLLDKAAVAHPQI